MLFQYDGGMTLSQFLQVLGVALTMFLAVLATAGAALTALLNIVRQKVPTGCTIGTLIVLAAAGCGLVWIKLGLGG